MSAPPPCDRPPCPTLLAAVRQFNAGDYFLCHETLEELWLDRNDPLRDLYKGILQVAVGLLHLQKGNLKGARTLLTRGLELIDPFTPSCRGLDLADLQGQARRVLHTLEDRETGGTPPRGGAGEHPQIRLVASDA